MIIPAMTLPEMIFGGFVLTCFAAFVLSLAGVHLYVTLPPRRRLAKATANRRAPSAGLIGASQLSTTYR